MARPDVNRFGEMEVFVRVVDLGGFSAAARALQMSPSAVSKLVTRLEARLGARLLQRSTRQLQVTPEGRQFYERSACVLADLAEAERSVATAAVPQGRLSVNTNVPFGTHVLLPLVPAFMARFPQVQLDIQLTDRVVDLIEARADVAVRAGPMKSSSLNARLLGSPKHWIVASPAYLARHGMPRSVAELQGHVRMGFNYARSVEGWPLLEGGPGGQLVHLPFSGHLQASDGEVLRQLAVAGVGLVRLVTFHIAADLAAGRLVPVLEDCNPGDTESFSAVYLGQGGPLPARVRALLDFLAENVRI